MGNLSIPTWTTPKIAFSPRRHVPSGQSRIRINLNNSYQDVENGWTTGLSPSLSVCASCIYRSRRSSWWPTFRKWQNRAAAAAVPQHAQLVFPPLPGCCWFLVLHLVRLLLGTSRSLCLALVVVTFIVPFISPPCGGVYGDSAKVLSSPLLLYSS